MVEDSHRQRKFSFERAPPGDCVRDCSLKERLPPTIKVLLSSRDLPLPLQSSSFQIFFIILALRMPFQEKSNNRKTTGDI